jgi:hypothetical protein
VPVLIATLCMQDRTAKGGREGPQPKTHTKGSNNDNRIGG